MALFEYLAIAYSLVISFAVLRVASGLPHALASGRRYWVHAAWALVNLAGSLLVFWTFWSYREVDWTLVRFVLVLANPTLIFIGASILLPDEPDRVQSWREYFYSIRVRFFVTGILWVVVVLQISTFVLHMPLLHPYRAVQLVVLGIYAVGLLSSRPAVHHALVILAPLLLIAAALVFIEEPGSLAPSALAPRP